MDADGRIAALVMRDVAMQHRKLLSDRAVVFDLLGVAGSVWKVGTGEVAATIRMDVLEFNIFASGRFTFDEARTRATISGDVQLAEQVMKQTLILY